jgi:hypothetical protein
MEVRSILYRILLVLLMTVLGANARKIHKIIPLSNIIESPHTGFLTRYGVSSAGATVTIKFK